MMLLTINDTFLIPTKVSVRAALTRQEREEMALEWATAVLIFDEESGLVFEGYNRDLADMMCILKWYTDVELTPYASEEGRYVIYDILESNGTMQQIREIVNEDLAAVLCIYSDLRTAAQRTFVMPEGAEDADRITMIREGYRAFFGSAK